ncbi:MAG: KH domain-containing protein [Acidobacteriaceae bacterium]|jgi:predicted RNA-binding protein YlqC (UPF0109 family)|nr:KH domain-containing protein [Acidobacteriaceae bacterium]
MTQATEPVDSTTPGAPAPDMVALFTAIARTLVSEPDEVEVEAFDEDDATVIEVVVAPDDVTRLIGKGGRTARALRTILAAASAKLNQKFELDIVEDDDEDDEVFDEDDDNRGNRA